MEVHTLNVPWKLCLQFDKLWVGEGKPCKFIDSQRFLPLLVWSQGWLDLFFLLLEEKNTPARGARGQLKWQLSAFVSGLFLSQTKVLWRPSRWGLAQLCPRGSWPGGTCPCARWQHQCHPWGAAVTLVRIHLLPLLQRLSRVKLVYGFKFCDLLSSGVSNTMSIF